MEKLIGLILAIVVALGVMAIVPMIIKGIIFVAIVYAAYHVLTE